MLINNRMKTMSFVTTRIIIRVSPVSPYMFSWVSPFRAQHLNYDERFGPHLIMFHFQIKFNGY